MNNRCCGHCFLYLGIVVGFLDWLLDMIYAMTASFSNTAIQSGIVAFVLIQPLWYLFLFIVYMMSHPNTDGVKQRVRFILLAPLYALLMQMKLVSGTRWFYSKFIIKTGIDPDR